MNHESERNWREVVKFAQQYSGYDEMGGFDQCGDLANAAQEAFSMTGVVPADERELRACLFFEARRWRHFGSEPDESAWSYIETLLKGLGRGADGRPIGANREAEYRRSSFYEQLVEHVFVSEILQEAWFGFGEVVEVLRSEVDASGYDLVLECRGVLRYVQLKTSRVDARTASQKISLALAEKPGGCVVWIQRKEDGDARRVRLQYLFFGGVPGAALPGLEGFSVAKHTKANSKGVKTLRPGLRVVPKARFEQVATTTELLDRLFGLKARR
jgi:hypothetical protein